MRLVLENHRRKDNLLTESKQNIVNLGLPEIIASILINRFGKKAFTLAKWFRDYNSSADARASNVGGDPWWHSAFWKNRSSGVHPADLIDLYESIEKGKKEYIDTLKYLEFERPEEDIDWDLYLKESKEELRKEIESTFLDNHFFTYKTLPKDIASGKLKDIGPYKDLSYKEAEGKYLKRKVFDETEPTIKYKDGWKWIDVGGKCELIGDQMKNCGSTGVMSNDPDKTMMGLFDPNNKPHIVGTLSPNQKRLSGVEGVASTGPKDKYIDKILNLVDVLGVEYDIWRGTKNDLLRLKYQFKDYAEDIDRVEDSGERQFGEEQFFKIVSPEGNLYTDSYSSLSIEEADKIIEYIKSKEGKELKKNLMRNRVNRQKRKKLILYDYLRFMFHHNNEIDIRKIFPGFNPIKNVKFLMDREKENSIAESKKKQIKIIIERKKK